MATIYVRSTDGSDSDNGSTWALAKATAAGVDAIDAAGDTIWFSQNHSESTAGMVLLSYSGTLVSPLKLLCGNDAAQPPTSLTTGATIATTGANSLYVWGYLFVYGVTFIAGDSTSSANLLVGGGSGADSVFENCTFYVRGSGSTGSMDLTQCVINGCTFRLSNASQTVKISGTTIRGGSWSASTTSPTYAFNVGFGLSIVEDHDLSNLSSTVNLMGVQGSTTVGKLILRNCKLPNSWTGSLCNATQPRFRAEMHNCDSGDTNYRLWVEDYWGSIQHDTGVYNDAGASDGTTRFSWKMVSSANATYVGHQLRSPEIVKWNDTTGSSVTVTVEIVHNSQGSGTNGVLNDDEIWLEVSYLGTSGVPLGSFMTDAKGGDTANVYTNFLSTAAAQTTSSASWTGDSTGWDTQKLSVTFTPQEKGYIHAVVCLAKASATVYVDPLLIVT